MRWIAKVVVAALVTVLVPSVVRADGPPGRYTLDEHTVRDEVTGLLWQRVASTTPSRWADAEAYCRTLEVGGRDGWRLPDVKELRSLVDVRRTLPTLDPIAFPEPSPSVFWTATGVAENAAYAWVVNFSRSGVSPPTNGRRRRLSGACAESYRRSGIGVFSSPRSV